MLKFLCIMFSLWTLLINQSFAQENPTQTEQIVHDYIVKHPEVLVEASQVLQKRALYQDIAKNIPSLFFARLSPVSDNPRGNVTIIEFFDYQCGYCKDAAPALMTALAQDKNIRMVFKEFPIFGKNSELASKAALAANAQGKYLDMYKALMNTRQPLSAEIVMDVAKTLHLNLAQLKTEMNDIEIIKELQVNRELAKQLKIMGTPVFMIAATPQWGKQGWQLKQDSISFAMGKLDEAQLKSMIKKAREAKA